MEIEIFKAGFQWRWEKCQKLEIAQKDALFWMTVDMLIYKGLDEIANL